MQISRDVSFVGKGPSQFEPIPKVSSLLKLNHPSLQFQQVHMLNASGLGIVKADSQSLFFEPPTANSFCLRDPSGWMDQSSCEDSHCGHSHGVPGNFTLPSIEQMQKMQALMMQQGMDPQKIRMPTPEQMQKTMQMMQQNPGQFQQAMQMMMSSRTVGTGQTLNTTDVGGNVLFDQLKKNIFEAIQVSNVNELSQIIANNPQIVNEKGFNGMSPLHKAVTSRPDPDVIRLLVQHKADVAARNDYDETPLHMACRIGHPGVAHVLIEAGASLSDIDKAGRNVMHHAALGGSVLMMFYLNSVHGVDTHAEDKNLITPLHLTCAQGHVEAFEYLLRNSRCKLSGRDIHGNTPLHIAAQYGRMLIVWRLIEIVGKKALFELNSDGLTSEDLAKQGTGPIYSEVVNVLHLYKDYKTDTGKVTGPSITWYLLLLLGPLAFYLILLLGQLFDSPGWTTVAFTTVIGYILGQQGRRMNHVSRWPNPLACGIFGGGILTTALVYFMWMVPELLLGYRVLTIVTILLAVAGLVMYFQLLRKDPGYVHSSAINEKTGNPYTVLDIAKGTIRLEALCTVCEIIPPRRSHHCRLCNHCMYDLDHHCVWLYKCIARHNHWNFVIFLTYVMVGNLVFLGMTYLYVDDKYPTLEGYKYWTAFFHTEYPIMALALMHVCTAVYIGNLLRHQVAIISRGFTTAYTPYYGQCNLTKSDRIKNIINFVKQRPVYKEDGPNKELNA